MIIKLKIKLIKLYLVIVSLVFSHNIIGLSFWPGKCDNLNIYSAVSGELTDVAPALETLATDCATQAAIIDAAEAAAVDPEGIAALPGIIAEATAECEAAGQTFNAAIDGPLDSAAKEVGTITECFDYYSKFAATVAKGESEYATCQYQMASLALKIGLPTALGKSSATMKIANMGAPAVFDMVNEHVASLSSDIDAIQSEIDDISIAVKTAPEEAEELSEEVEEAIGESLDEALTDMKTALNGWPKNPVVLEHYVIGALCSRYVPLCVESVLASCDKQK
tara:strand:- start:11603 stop:12442 length:840 start_codon:yes stop_codon:yes gene_type:complete